jgi:hypothetical protein
VLLKALACQQRGKDKDKYDLFYVIRNYREGPSAVADHFRPFLTAGRSEAQEALKTLSEYFDDPRSIGPVAVSQFVYGEPNDALQADAVAFAGEFLAQLRD